ncbi:galactosylceramide sulfotransferase-like isoform X2 [Apostichopus japonicus]|uniref:galactosylceramide sulfotransferase-like isoform X2 n=1 Tax=Stichopus japonicus TaxID=307972 RepID=UPI003AB67A76
MTFRSFSKRKVWQETNRFVYILCAVVCVLIPLSLRTVLPNEAELEIDVKSWVTSEDSHSLTSRHTLTGSQFNQSYNGFQYKCQPSICSRQENVVFIKTHKTGGTTVQSIMYRYGYIRDLSFVIRRTNEKNGHFRHMELTKDSPKKMFLPLLDTGTCSFRGYNMSAIHVVHNWEIFESFMNPGTKYITILRDPVFQLRSAFVFFSLYKGVRGITIENKLLNYMRGNSWKWQVYGKNSQSKDLGLKTEYFEDEAKIKLFINQLDIELDLVLIHEYFDESVVLLARELCWNLEDVVFTIENNRSNHKPNLDSELLDSIRKFNHADVLLYDHFNQTFWKRIEQQGPMFWRDLEEFRKLQNKTMYKCFNSSTIPEDYVSGHNISDYCDRYTGGLYLFKNVYKRQHKTC